jgi:hypothetical protein
LQHGAAAEFGFQKIGHGSSLKVKGRTKKQKQKKASSQDPHRALRACESVGTPLSGSEGFSPPLD